MHNSKKKQKKKNPGAQVASRLIPSWTLALTLRLVNWKDICKHFLVQNDKTADWVELSGHFKDWYKPLMQFWLF